MTHPPHNIESTVRAWTEVCRTSAGRDEYWHLFGDYLFTGRGIPDELFSLPPAALRPKASRRQRKPSLAHLVAKAKRLGVDVTLEPNGAATFHCSSGASDAVINEWDEVLPRHGTH